MVGFKVQINDKKFLHVALKEKGVATLIFVLQKKKSEKSKRTDQKNFVQSGLLESHATYQEYGSWPDKPLRIGDKIVIEVAEIKKPSRPKSFRRETEADRRKQKLAYVAKLKKG